MSENNMWPTCWMMLGSALLLFALGSWGCSGAASTSCETTDDCFEGEFCDDGSCRPNDGPGTGSTDNGTGANEEQNNEEQNNEEQNNEEQNNEEQNNEEQNNEEQNNEEQNNEEQNNEENGPCAASVPCEDNIDDPDLYKSQGLLIEPDDENHDTFGCVQGSDQELFIDDVPEPLEVRSCPGDEQRFRIDVRQCESKQFVLEIEVTPELEACPAEPWETVSATTGGFYECEDSGQVNCHVEETLGNGGYRWEMRYGRDDYTSFQTARIRLEPVAGTSFPYEVKIDIVD